MECHDSSIMKNDVWVAVPRREGKFVMTSNGTIRSSMLQTVVLKSIRQDLWLEVSPRKKENIMKKPFRL